METQTQTQGAEMLQKILNRLAHGKVLNADEGITMDEIKFLIAKIKGKLQRKPMAMIDVQAPVMICGDLHGQYQDVLRIFNKYGWPPEKTYLFLGDYVDRGDRSIEIVCLMFAMHLAYPRNVYILRGNHECRETNAAYGFKTECNNRFGSEANLWQQFNDVFDWLPLCALVGGRILCMHGGIPCGLTKLDQLRCIPIPNDCSKEGFAAELLWSDPGDNPGFVPSARGLGYTFGADELEWFCQRMNIDMVCRAHQWFMEGYNIFGSQRLVTIFGAPNYAGIYRNDAASLFVDADLKCELCVMPPA